jgi:hypothetical protein
MNRYLPILCTLAISLWNAQPAGAETRKVCNDFDDDGQTDPAIYYPASGLWQVMLSDSGWTVTNVTVGGGNYLPAPGDYDGDGKADFVVFDSTTATWWGKFSNGEEGSGTFGQPGTWPVPADYDGDRVTDLGVYDPLTGIWSVLSLSKGWSGSGTCGYLGASHSLGPQTYTVLPMPFDYNQDGVDDLGYYYRGTSMTNSGWSILYIGIGPEDYIWGSSGSLPAPGKYEAKTNATPYYAYGLCVYKIVNREVPAKSAEWSIPHRSSALLDTGSFILGVYGETLPVSAGDYDGNGFDDNAVYNYVTGEWTIIFNTGGLAVDGREQANGFLGGPTAVPANIYSTLYRLGGYSPKPW